MNFEPVTLSPVEAPQYFPTTTVSCGARQKICFALAEADNTAVNLGDVSMVTTMPEKRCITCEPEFGEPATFQDGIEPKKDWPDNRVVLAAVECYGQAPQFVVDGEVLSYDQGTVVFHLTEEQLQYPGILVAEVQVYRGPTLLRRWPFYLSVENAISLNLNTASNTRTVLTVPEVRLFLRDLVPEANDLLEDVEFKDAEIVRSMIRPVDLWNETPPNDQRLYYSAKNFPFRENHLKATIGFLLEISAHWYRRNNVDIQAAGNLANDRRKFNDYEVKSQQLLKEYREWAQTFKYTLSAQGAWGTLTSTFPYSAGY